MLEISQEVTDAVTGTYAAWHPYTAATAAADTDCGGDAFASARDRIAALQARIEHNRANPVFGAEPSTIQTGA